MPFSSKGLYAQCETWQKSAKEIELKDAFIIYRSLLTDGNNEQAFPYWEKVYLNCPAADGLRADVFSDGRTFYIEKFNQSKNRKEKAEFAKIIRQLLEEEKSCYPDNKVILPPKYIMEFGLRKN